MSFDSFCATTLTVDYVKLKMFNNQIAKFLKMCHLAQNNNCGK